MAFKLNLNFNARWNHKHKCIPNQKKKKEDAVFEFMIH